MNKTCGIIRDLMPLVIDHVSSKESSNLVETHMAVCPECAEYYREMKAGVPAGDENEKKEESVAFTQAARKLKRKRRWRTVRIILLSLVLVFGLLAGGVALFRGLQQVKVPMHTGQYRIFLSRLEDGSAVATANYNESSVQLYTWVEDAVEKVSESGKEIKVAYLRIDKTLIPDPLYNPPMQNKGFIRFTAEELENTYDEIRQGQSGDYITLWKKGQEIEKASAEMDEYYYWDDLLESLFLGPDSYADSNAGDYSLWIWYDALHSRQSAVEYTVPEWQPWHGYQFEPNEKMDSETVEWLLSQLENAGVPIDRSKIHSLKPTASPAPEQ